MKVKHVIKSDVELDVASVRCDVAVRYDEEDMPNDYPHRHGNMWNIVIDMNTGQINDWPAGVPPRDLYMKVCDEGRYQLLASDGSKIVEEKDGYVPRFFSDEHFGDYLIFSIDASGRITNWNVTADELAEFLTVEDE